MQNSNSSLLLSIVVPTLNINNLQNLFASLKNLISNDVEFVLVNQTGSQIPTEISRLLKINFTEVCIDKVSASAARNIGVKNANGYYLWFMDDDAWVQNPGQENYDCLIDILSHKDALSYVAQRGFVSNNNYITSWDKRPLTIKNFPAYLIEWNFFVQKELFEKLGGFDESIGVGSRGAAQAGEAFLLAAKILSKNIPIYKLDFLHIAHPSLTQIKYEKQVRYAYGTGYTVGKILKDLSMSNKIYWSGKIVVSVFYHFLRGNFAEMRRLNGFWDGIRNVYKTV